MLSKFTFCRPFSRISFEAINPLSSASFYIGFFLKRNLGEGTALKMFIFVLGDIKWLANSQKVKKKQNNELKTNQPPSPRYVVPLPLGNCAVSFKRTKTSIYNYVKYVTSGVVWEVVETHWNIVQPIRTFLWQRQEFLSLLQGRKLLELKYSQQLNALIWGLKERTGQSWVRKLWIKQPYYLVGLI